MLATDRFLLGSIGRTGTGAPAKWLQEIEGLQIISAWAHESFGAMARKCEEAGVAVPPAWTIIRNPWDWYVDVYLWQRKHAIVRARTFKEFIWSTRHEPGRDGYFRSETAQWHGLGADEAQYVTSFENYDEEVTHTVLALIPDLITEEEIRQKIEETESVGDSFTLEGNPWRLEPPGSYRDYYDDESRCWVAEMDQKIIERFGYDFMEGPFRE